MNGKHDRTVLALGVVAGLQGAEHETGAVSASGGFASESGEFGQRLEAATHVLVGFGRKSQGSMEAVEVLGTTRASSMHRSRDRVESDL